MAKRTLLDVLTLEEVEAEHRRVRALICEDRERQRRLRLSLGIAAG